MNPIPSYKSVSNQFQCQDIFNALST